MLASAITAVGGAATLVVNAGVPHGVVWVEFFTALAGTTKAVPTAGTVAFTGRPDGAPGYTIALTGSPMTAGAPDFVTWSGPVDLITATPSSVSGNSVTHYRLVARQYQS